MMYWLVCEQAYVVFIFDAVIKADLQLMRLTMR